MAWNRIRNMVNAQVISGLPVTGYDGNTTAEDIYQLVSQLGLGEKIHLVGHDVGAQTAYSYAAAL